MERQTIYKVVSVVGEKNSSIRGLGTRVYTVVGLVALTEKVTFV